MFWQFIEKKKIIKSFYFSGSVYGNYAQPPEYKTSETFVLYNIPLWGWSLIALPIMGIVIVCLALAAWKIIVYVTKFEDSNRPNRSDPKVLCPLCVKKVREQNWKHGNHRVKCARKYQAKIQNEWPIFERSSTVASGGSGSGSGSSTMPCPECGQSLRKISTASRLFYCHSSNCTSETISVGCFICDFHLCQNCVDRQISETQRRSFVSPKLDFEPSAPSYDMVVSNDHSLRHNNSNYVNLNADNNISKDEEDDYLPSYEQAIAMNKETQE